ncbi:hypothetical protein Lser_V15G13234 [Lactuca serriola]
MEEVERGERMPLPQSAVLGAKDLPRTILSDHIESRLFGKLKQERLERTRFYGKTYDEVPGAEALVVRVVSSVDKKLEVKQQFLDIFQEENYSVEFGYKSKHLSLHFFLYNILYSKKSTQLYALALSCGFVKYFRPEIKAVTGEALRTFVYHEILYVQHSKTSMSFKTMDDGQVLLYAFSRDIFPCVIE